MFKRFNKPQKSSEEVKPNLTEGLNDAEKNELKTNIQELRVLQRNLEGLKDENGNVSASHKANANIIMDEISKKLSQIDVLQKMSPNSEFAKEKSKANLIDSLENEIMEIEDRIVRIQNYKRGELNNTEVAEDAAQRANELKLLKTELATKYTKLDEFKGASVEAKPLNNKQTPHVEAQLQSPQAQEIVAAKQELSKEELALDEDIVAIHEALSELDDNPKEENYVANRTAFIEKISELTEKKAELQKNRKEGVAQLITTPKQQRNGFFANMKSFGQKAASWFGKGVEKIKNAYNESNIDSETKNQLREMSTPETSDSTSAPQEKKKGFWKKALEKLNGKNNASKIDLNANSAQFIDSQDATSQSSPERTKEKIDWKKVREMAKKGALYTGIGVGAAGAVTFCLPVLLTATGIGTVGLGGGIAASGVANISMLGTYSFAQLASAGIVGALPTSAAAASAIVAKTAMLAGASGLIGAGSGIGLAINKFKKKKPESQPFQAPSSKLSEIILNPDKTKRLVEQAEQGEKQLGESADRILDLMPEELRTHENREELLKMLRNLQQTIIAEAKAVVDEYLVEPSLDMGIPENYSFDDGETVVSREKKEKDFAMDTKLYLQKVQLAETIKTRVVNQGISEDDFRKNFDSSFDSVFEVFKSNSTLEMHSDSPINTLATLDIPEFRILDENGNYQVQTMNDLMDIVAIDIITKSRKSGPKLLNPAKDKPKPVKPESPQIPPIEENPVIETKSISKEPEQTEPTSPVAPENEKSKPILANNKPARETITFPDPWLADSNTTETSVTEKSKPILANKSDETNTVNEGAVLEIPENLKQDTVESVKNSTENMSEIDQAITKIEEQIRFTLSKINHLDLSNAEKINSATFNTIGEFLRKLKTENPALFSELNSMVVDKIEEISGDSNKYNLDILTKEERDKWTDETARKNVSDAVLELIKDVKKKS
jgi:hypothetical protein